MGDGTSQFTAMGDIAMRGTTIVGHGSQRLASHHLHPVADGMTASGVPLRRCWIQPMVAETMASGSSASMWPC